jgi:hypothetical protein
MKSSLRIFLLVAEREEWNLSSIDIKTAFLQRAAMDKRIYIRPLKEAGKAMEIVWLRLKAAYERFQLEGREQPQRNCRGSRRLFRLRRNRGVQEDPDEGGNVCHRRLD